MSSFELVILRSYFCARDFALVSGTIILEKCTGTYYSTIGVLRCAGTPMYYTTNWREAIACPCLWRSRSDKNDYRQQEVLQEEVSPIIRGTPEDKRSFQ